jgi:hypothetical protein
MLRHCSLGVRRLSLILLTRLQPFHEGFCNSCPRARPGTLLACCVELCTCMPPRVSNSARSCRLSIVCPSFVPCVGRPAKNQQTDPQASTLPPTPRHPSTSPLAPCQATGASHGCARCNCHATRLLVCAPATPHPRAPHVHPRVQLRTLPVRVLQLPPAPALLLSPSPLLSEPQHSTEGRGGSRRVLQSWGSSQAGQGAGTPPPLCSTHQLPPLPNVALTAGGR